VRAGVVSNGRRHHTRRHLTFNGTSVLHLAQGTLADAETTIEELYAWELDGKRMRDFTGYKPTGARNAGAVEFEP